MLSLIDHSSHPFEAQPANLQRMDRKKLWATLGASRSSPPWSRMGTLQTSRLRHEIMICFRYMHSQASIVLRRCHYVQPCIIMIMCNSTGPVQTVLHIISCVHHWNGSLFHVALLRLGTFLLAAWTINLCSTPEFQLCSAHHSCHSSLAYIIKIERTTPTDSKGASNNAWEYTVACYHLKHLQFKCRVSSAALKCCLSEAAEATPATSTSPVFVVFLSKPAGYGKSTEIYLIKMALLRYVDMIMFSRNCDFSDVSGSAWLLLTATLSNCATCGMKIHEAANCQNAWAICDEHKA